MKKMKVRHESDIHTHSFIKTVEEPKKLQRKEESEKADDSDDEDDKGATWIVVHTHSFSNTVEEEAKDLRMMKLEKTLYDLFSNEAFGNKFAHDS